MTNFFTAADRIILLYKKGDLPRSFAFYDLVRDAYEAKDDLEDVVDYIALLNRTLATEKKCPQRTKAKEEQIRVQEDGLEHFEKKFDKFRTELAHKLNRLPVLHNSNSNHLSLQELNSHIAAYNKGLMTSKHPLFELTEEAVLADDALQGLYNYEDNLANERCEETGAHVDNQQKVDDLDDIIQKAIKRHMRAQRRLQKAINNQ